MTNAEAIVAEAGIDLGFPDTDIAKAASDFTLDPAATYNAGTDKLKVYAAAAKLLTTVLMLQSTSQGGFSVSFDLEGVKNRIVWLAGQSGGLFVVPDSVQGKQRGVRARNLW